MEKILASEEVGFICMLRSNSVCWIFLDLFKQEASPEEVKALLINIHCLSCKVKKTSS